MSVEYVGPFERWQVVVDGLEVPHLTAQPQPGGLVSLTLDRRFGLDLIVADAELVVPFLAHAIAVAAGWSCHGQDAVPLPHAPRLIELPLELDPSTKDLA